MTGSPVSVASGLPAVVTSRTGAPLEAVLDHRNVIEQLLRSDGAVLLRGFQLGNDVARFEDLVRELSGEPLPYVERSSPRHTVSGHIYTATDHPPTLPIFLHNEQSYNVAFPARLHFACQQPAAAGGATTLADARRVLDRIPDDLRDRLGSLGYLYIRHLREEVGLSWQQVFQTTSRDEAKAYCRAHDIELTWLADDEARTVQRREVVARHPVTGEPCWFNHCTFFHVSTLGEANAATLRSVFGPDGLPNQTAFGDGSPIEDDDCDRLRQAYLRSAVEVEWTRGDVLIVDNLLASHGRTAFAGERSVVVAMTGSTSWSDVAETPCDADRGESPSSSDARQDTALD